MPQSGEPSQSTNGQSVVDAISTATPQQFFTFCQHVALTRLSWPVADALGVAVFVRRDDLIDPIISGNKAYKLWGHIQHYRRAVSLSDSLPKVPIVSFGGAFSNHLHALSGFARTCRIPCVGVIRGNRPATLSPTLKDLERFGMRLIFVSRSAYKAKTTPEFKQSLISNYALPSTSFFVEEGGGGKAGQDGCEILGRAIAQDSSRFDAVIQSCGTGTTLAGLARGFLSARAEMACSIPQLIGVSALKSQFGIVRCVERAIADLANNAELAWYLSNQFHLGGYAKRPPQLMSFMDRFHHETGIRLDHVYTAKTFLALQQLVQAGLWPKGSRILVIHSGGLQGNRQIEKSSL